MVVYLEKMMERLNSGEEKIIFRIVLCFVIIGLTRSGRAAWQQEEETRKKSVLYWFFRSSSVPPSSPRSFRTQSYWSFITGQCRYSGRFLQVHLSRWMCNQFTLLHEFRIDTGRTKFEQQTDSILSACGSHEQRTQRSWDSRLESTASCTILAHSVEETSEHGVLGRHQSCSEERIEVLSNTIKRHHSFTIHSQHIVSRKLFGVNWRKIIDEKIHASPRPPPRISLKHDWMKELGSEVARKAEGSQPTLPKPSPNHDRTGRPVVGRDASHAQGHEQSMLNEDIDFRISGLPHSVVKQAENSRVRELVKKIENHPHRQDLQADLQQHNAYNPFSEKSKKMIKDMGNVELFELCETIPKVQCKECLLHWNQGIVYCTCGHLLKESEASRGILQWTLDLLSIPNYVIKKGRPHGHRHGKTEEQRQHHIAHNLT